MLTGQWPEFGQGSMKTYLSMPNIFRVAWWNLGSAGNNTNTEVAQLYNPHTGEVTPEGRAVLAHYDPERADCLGEN